MILRNLAVRGAGRPWVAELITLVVLSLCPLVLPLLGIGADMASRILIWGLFGLGFDILFGFTGLLSFGQAAFFGVGGFVSAFLLTQAGMTNVVLALQRARRSLVDGRAAAGSRCTATTSATPSATALRRPRARRWRSRRCSCSRSSRAPSRGTSASPLRAARSAAAACIARRAWAISAVS